MCDLRPGEFTATHTGPLSWRDYALQLERDVAFLAQMMIHGDAGHSTPAEHARLHEIAARYPRFATGQDVEDVEPVLGEQTGPAPG